METHFPKQVITSTKQSLSPKTPITTKDTHGSSFIYTLFHTKMLNRGETDVYITWRSKGKWGSESVVESVKAERLRDRVVLLN